jgi:hypothetical protein
MLNTRNASENKSRKNVREWNAANTPNWALLQENCNAIGEEMKIVMNPLKKSAKMFLLVVQDVPENNVVTLQRRMEFQQISSATLLGLKNAKLKLYPNVFPKRFPTSVLENNVVITKNQRVNPPNCTQLVNGLVQKCVIRLPMRNATWKQQPMVARDVNAVNSNVLEEIQERLSNVNLLLRKNAQKQLLKNVNLTLWVMDVFKRYVAKYQPSLERNLLFHAKNTNHINAQQLNTKNAENSRQEKDVCKSCVSNTARLVIWQLHPNVSWMERKFVSQKQRRYARINLLERIASDHGVAKLLLSAVNV